MSDKMGELAGMYFLVVKICKASDPEQGARVLGELTQPFHRLQIDSTVRMGGKK